MRPAPTSNSSQLQDPLSIEGFYEMVSDYAGTIIAEAESERDKSDQHVEVAIRGGSRSIRQPEASPIDTDTIPGDPPKNAQSSHLQAQKIASETASPAKASDGHDGEDTSQSQGRHINRHDHHEEEVQAPRPSQASLKQQCLLESPKLRVPLMPTQYQAYPRPDNYDPESQQRNANVQFPSTLSPPPATSSDPASVGERSPFGRVFTGVQVQGGYNPPPPPVNSDCYTASDGRQYPLSDHASNYGYPPQSITANYQFLSRRRSGRASPIQQFVYSNQQFISQIQDPTPPPPVQRSSLVGQNYGSQLGGGKQSHGANQQFLSHLESPPLTPA